MKWLNSAAAFVATMGYVGYVPVSPGTAGSAVALLLLWFLPEIPPALFGISCVLLLAVGVWTGGLTAFNHNAHDPSHVVIDEWLGMWLSVALLPKTFLLYGIAFLLFRFFDVLKPFPLNRLEDLPGGWGIMLDDVAAGIVTWVIVAALHSFWVF